MPTGCVTSRHHLFSWAPSLNANAHYKIAYINKCIGTHQETARASHGSDITFSRNSSLYIRRRSPGWYISPYSPHNFCKMIHVQMNQSIVICRRGTPRPDCWGVPVKRHVRMTIAMRRIQLLNVPCVFNSRSRTGRPT